MNIQSLQTDYLNVDSSSGFGRNGERTNTVQTKCTFLGGTNHSAYKCLKNIRQEKVKALADDALDNRQTERTHRKYSRCGSEDHLIEKCPNPPKYN